MDSTLSATIQSYPVAPQFPASYQRGMQRIMLPYLNRTIYISVDDVLCLEGEGNYTFLHTRDRKRYLVSKTLKEFEKMLDSSLFLRIHKSYIVNMAYTQRSIFHKERSIRLADGRDVAISRRRMKSISQQVAAYWQRLFN